mmetsp:Transcript_31167/g.52119  ORF Transcript_31167/g.52119 Transcript_31167/m.52119 type:complete len:375 (+) Transcript_31167:91-1215(+)|eukprot:CAMPEP_0174979278 /NCGR_PEP_ID=MMETSP0004_2-20121128/14684_1 /TAXON_ID=420556 /ORGANISM="Ochromonas sp., Strain CCMP1393" /LENGTH=374 /DNA_ID=CAMNT_0016230771 /DNA_START=76 /DNA_END=1200 /DNA_ORIENTATION=-
MQIRALLSVLVVMIFGFYSSASTAAGDGEDYVTGSFVLGSAERRMLLKSKNSSPSFSYSSRPCDRLPTRFHLGMPKTGSSSLYGYLVSHGLIGNSNHSKEVPFFIHANQTSAEYCDMYKYAGKHKKRPLFDMSVSHYFNLDLVAKFFEDDRATKDRVTFSVVYRDPITRLLSWYNHMAAFGMNVNSQKVGKIAPFNMESLRKYAEQDANNALNSLNTYLIHFKPSQLLLMQYDDVQADFILFAIKVAAHHGIISAEEAAKKKKKHLKQKQLQVVVANGGKSGSRSGSGSRHPAAADMEEVPRWNTYKPRVTAAAIDCTLWKQLWAIYQPKYTAIANIVATQDFAPGSATGLSSFLISAATASGKCRNEEGTGKY